MLNIAEQINPRKFLQTFKARTDRIVVYARKKVISQQIKRGDFELINRIGGHIEGKVRVGFYNMLEDNTIPWVVVNFMEGGESDNVARDSAMFRRELVKLGLRGTRRERTMMPQEEYNVWTFFEKPISAKKVRYFLFTLFERLSLSKQTPIIPTIDTLNPGSYGQHVWLPYFNGIDKWFDENGQPYVCKGVKDQQTVFIDDDGNVLEQGVLEIARSTEVDLDQALEAITGPLEDKYLPGVGLHIQESSFFKMIEGCEALKNLIQHIEQDGKVSEEGMLRLAVLLDSLQMNNLLEKYLKKAKNIDKKKFQKKFDKYTGNVFPTCLDWKQVGFCPPGKVCFAKRSPIRERMGMWRVDKKAEATLEPTNAPWLFRAIGEQVAQAETAAGAGEEGGFAPPGMAAAPAAGAAVEVKSMEEFIDEYTKKLEEKKKIYASTQTPISGLNTGFDILNGIIDGLKEGTLLALAGPPGSGKSTFANQILVSVAENEKVPCIYITYDLSVEQLHRKTLSRLSGISLAAINRGALSGEDWGKVTEINDYIKESLGNLIYVTEADHRTYVTAIEKAIDDSKAKLAVVDYIEAIPFAAAYMDTQLRKMNVFASLKQAARRKGVSIIAVSNNKISSALKYSADVVLNMYSHVNPKIASSSKQPCAVLVNVEKNREGKSLASIQYTFYPPRMTFYSEKLIEYRPLKY